MTIIRNVTAVRSSRIMVLTVLMIVIVIMATTYYVVIVAFAVVCTLTCSERLQLHSIWMEECDLTVNMIIAGIWP